MTFAHSLTPWQRVLDSGNVYFCEPVRAGDAADFYWRTDLKTTEIVAAFYQGCHQTKLCEFVGPARLVGLDCKRCAKPIHVFSRTDAANRVRSLTTGEWSGHYWADPAYCRECERARRDEYNRTYHQRERERWVVQERRQQDLRFMPYADYLKTPEWKATRETAKRRARYQCQTCANSGELHVHHRTYARRGNEHPADLIVLCADCHELFHKNGRLAENGRAA